MKRNKYGRDSYEYKRVKKEDSYIHSDKKKYDEDKLSEATDQEKKSKNNEKYKHEHANNLNMKRNNSIFHNGDDNENNIHSIYTSKEHINDNINSRNKSHVIQTKYSKGNLDTIIPPSDNYNNTSKMSVKYRKMSSTYGNLHKNVLTSSSNQKDIKSEQNINAEKKESFVNNIIDLKKSELFIKEDKSEEEINNNLINKFYGDIKIKKTNNNIIKASYDVIRKKINTDIKLNDILDMIKLPESENLDNDLKTPCISNQKIINDILNEGKSNVNPNSPYQFYNDLWTFPLEMLDKYIFKNKNHDYKKWISNCTTLFVLGLPFQMNEYNLLHNLIDVYYMNKNYDGLLDIIDINKEDSLFNHLYLYSYINQPKNKYNLLSEKLGILKFDLLFGSEYHLAKNEMLNSYLNNKYKEFYKINCNTGAMGLLYFKNEQCAMDFWMMYNNYSSSFYEKYLKCIPDINGIKIYIEASMFYLTPDLFLTQINYSELNAVLNNIQKKKVNILQIFNDIKIYYNESSIWNLIFCNKNIEQFFKMKKNNENVNKHKYKHKYKYKYRRPH
ncbi:hypothetical protein PFBG_04373 [Plasmodium falciparum 7G8]|uniref:Uncharacterized protein n=1 Tax=Plasmodium falciparum (isolate 7G8) TaxID=57266 RepID=W7FHG4_PLAF8|nr:hypothetical protein PFBG_04373 [Plasmodium falciparum 7G8]